LSELEARSISSRLAPVLEALELDQPRVVTTANLAELATELGVDLDGTELAYQLRRRGWLMTLRTRGAWEFVPGSRAGRFGGGDRHIELRAALTVNPDFRGALAMESAAVALGLAGRVPDREVLALPPGSRLPKALDDWRVVRVVVGSDGVIPIDGLPVWRVETLLAAMATRPNGFHDWPNVAEWLDEAVSRADVTAVHRGLSGTSRSAWRRAGYLLSVGGKADEGVALLQDEPPGKGPVYLGPRTREGSFDRRFDVIDSVLAPSASGVQR
jgi:hypothetical protein